MFMLGITIHQHTLKYMSFVIMGEKNNNPQPMMIFIL
jgi:hypothetical protein